MIHKNTIQDNLIAGLVFLWPVKKLAEEILIKFAIFRYGRVRKPKSWNMRLIQGSYFLLLGSSLMVQNVSPTSSTSSINSAAISSGEANSTTSREYRTRFAAGGVGGLGLYTAYEALPVLIVRRRQKQGR